MGRRVAQTETTSVQAGKRIEPRQLPFRKTRLLARLKLSGCVHNWGAITRILRLEIASWNMIRKPDAIYAAEEEMVVHYAALHYQDDRLARPPVPHLGSRFPIGAEVDVRAPAADQPVTFDQRQQMRFRAVVEQSRGKARFEPKSTRRLWPWFILIRSRSALKA